MAQIRIGQVVEAATGGVARHLIDLVTHLDPTRFHCTLYLSFERPESWTERLLALVGPQVVIREIPMARLPNHASVNQLRGWFTRDTIDLVHLHSAKAGYHGRLAAQQVGLPTIYTPHAFPFQRTTDWLCPLYRIIERRLAARTSAIICVSEGEREQAEQAGLPFDKLVVVPNGIDPAQWPLRTQTERQHARSAIGLGPEELVVGAMGRCEPQKGFDLLIEAAEDFLPEFPRAHLCLWGEGPQRRAWQRLARALRLRRILFLGATSDPRAAFAAMDLFCAPSRWEGGPYAVLEAMASGLPVVATEIAGHQDTVIHGATGYLTEPELPGPLAGGIRNLLVDTDIRADYGAAGRRRALTHFTLPQMVDGTVAVYERVLARHRQRSAA